MLLRRPRINQLVNNILLPILTLAITVVLACFALGAVQTPPQELNGEIDAKGNKITGTYDPVDDVFLGKVNIVFPTGAVYNGSFEGYRFNGYGVFEGSDTAEDGTVNPWRFEGNFIEGHLEGEGSYTDSLGNYTGTFRNSLPNGQGVYTSHSGWRYEGEFQAGCMTGLGTVYLVDGTSTSGRFEDGLQVSGQE